MILVLTPVVKEMPLPIAVVGFDDFASVAPVHDPRPPALPGPALDDLANESVENR